MIIYSNKIIIFIAEIKAMIKEILSQELRCKVTQNRFYDRQQQASYPIHVVIFNTTKRLGYFDPSFFELGFHESLLFTSRNQLRNIIRHELAHYIIHIDHGPGIQPHGDFFRDFCRKNGWGEEVYGARTSPEMEEEIEEIHDNVLLRKVQKLMALAKSSNPHEAELAMIKSQQLLLEHNIQSRYVGREEEETWVLKRILQQKKSSPKTHAIASILTTFFVTTVYSRADSFVYLEIVGTPVNVEIAEYVASFLDSEMERLWDQAKKSAKLQGVIAKNSFFTGIAQGYCGKIESLKKNYGAEAKNGLMVLENSLIKAQSLIYPRLSHTKSARAHCHKSSLLGESMGRNLTINPGLTNSTKQSTLLLE